MSGFRLRIAFAARVVALAAALAAPMVAKAQEAAPSGGSLRASVGATYSTGDYGGTTRTQVFSAPFSLRYAHKRFTLRVSVPWVRVDGPGSLIDTPQGRDASVGVADDHGADDDGGGTATGEDGTGSVETCTATNSSESEDDTECPSATAAVVPAAVASAAPRGPRSGIGDVSITSGYGFALGRVASLDLAARLKVPTASRAKGLGTGRTDLTLTGSLSHDFGRGSLWVSARHRFLGKATGLKLRDTWGAGAGASYRLSPRFTLGVDYDWQQSATRRRTFSEVTGWAGVRLAQRLRLNAYAGAGLNAQSAKFVGGLTLSWLIN